MCVFTFGGAMCPWVLLFNVVFLVSFFLLLFFLFMIRMTSDKEGRNQDSQARDRESLCDSSHLQFLISHNKENDAKGKVRVRAVCRITLQLPTL